jgi:hypothetical protein
MSRKYRRFRRGLSGHVLWSDVAETALFIEGDRDLARQLPGWIRLDKVVGRDFPVVRPAA